MNTDRLLAHFDRISDAPDAVPRLRRLILNLAVRGRLVEQDPNDEPASELLKRIAAEKARLVKAGEIRKRKEPVILKETELPFKIPNNWKWVRLGELGVTQTGTTPSKNHNDHFGSHIPFIKPADLHPTHVDYSNEGLSEVGVEASGRVAGVGSILMVCIGTIGKCQLIDRNCSFNQQINSISPFGNLDSLYFLAACKSDFFQKAAWSASARTTIAILNKGNWEKLTLPLPPLAEQHRIVAKVDELMAMCDRLEAARARREATRDRLAAASLARLDEPDPETFQDHAYFALNALPALATRPDQIKQLRQTILNLAVRGRLVEQDPNDELASELLKRIKKTRDERHKRKLALIENDPTETDFDLPENWSLAPLIALGGWATGAGFPRSEQGRTEGPYFFLKVSDMNLPKNERVIVTAQNRIDDEVAARIRAKVHSIRTIIFPKIGGAIATNKRRILGRPSAIDNNCLGITIDNELDLNWAHLLLTSLDFTQYQAGTAVPALQQGVLERIAVGIPPLAEQHRIVARVDELLTLCDRLEASLTSRDQTRHRLLDALLHEALTA